MRTPKSARVNNQARVKFKWKIIENILNGIKAKLVILKNERAQSGAFIKYLFFCDLIRLKEFSEKLKNEVTIYTYVEKKWSSADFFFAFFEVHSYFAVFRSFPFCWLVLTPPTRNNNFLEKLSFRFFVPDYIQWRNEN